MTLTGSTGTGTKNKEFKATAGYSYEDVVIDPDVAEQFDMPLAFQECRHKEKIIGGASVAPTWRMKERVC